LLTAHYEIAGRGLVGVCLEVGVRLTGDGGTWWSVCVGEV
jgi:hypothetical protein